MTALLPDATADLKQLIAKLERQLQASIGERDVALARQAVTAQENAGLQNELIIARERQVATADILRAIASSAGNAEQSLHQIAETTARLFGASSVTLRIAKGDEWSHAVGVGASAQRVISQVAGRQQRVLADNLPGAVVLGNRQIHIPDLDHIDPSMASWPGLPHARASGTRVMCGTPLRRDGGVTGALIVYRDQLLPFTPEELALQQNFADQAVIAIENARLFNEVQARTHELAESLEQQTATSEVLSVISSSAGDLIPVFDAMLEKAMHLCGADFGVLNTYDGELFQTAATYGLPPAYDEYRRRQPLQYGPGTAPARLLEGEPIVELTDLLDSDAYRQGDLNRQALVDLGGARCLLAVPLLQDERVVGNVMIFRQDKRRFSEKQIKLLQQFAAQAVIAIENTRLLRELRESTEDLRESLQQQTATADVLKVISRSAFDLQSVLDTLVTSASTLCNADQGMLLLYEEGVLRPLSYFGPHAEKFEFRKSLASAPHRGTLSGRAVLDGRIAHAADVLVDPEFTNNPWQQLTGFRAMLAVPLMRQGQPIGAMALSRTAAGLFAERQIDLVTTFADQAVIAIENVRLFDEVQARTKELAASLDELRTAQDRLVQTEKLASLGQLTAGIAHEIKNPLNFVNNFAALSSELTDELNDVLKPAPLADAIREEVNELTGMLKDNLQKVVQHGKRADSIVKNMLLHSREGSGERRLTDVNALVEESLNLAYHGARAEKPQFNVTLDRDLAPDAGMVEMFPQEITRVMLNLVSNGFYAATKRKNESGDTPFDPVLRASTRNLGDRIEIRIRDNGTGIPPDVKEKMFNPFFTTKPAGEGTGLGLSMSHDIVVKQHGGTIEVETTPGEFTEFRIVLARKTS